MKFRRGPLSHSRYIIFCPGSKLHVFGGDDPHQVDALTLLTATLPFLDRQEGHKPGRHHSQCLSLSHLCADCESLCECCYFFFGWGSNLAGTSCRPPGPHPSLSQTKLPLANCICRLQPFISWHDTMNVLYVFFCFVFVLFHSPGSRLHCSQKFQKKDTRQVLSLSSNKVPCANAQGRLMQMKGAKSPPLLHTRSLTGQM